MKPEDFGWGTPRWVRSSYCSSGGCVEVALNSLGLVLVRDSKLGDESPVLVFDQRAWDLTLSSIRVYNDVPGVLMGLDDLAWRREGVELLFTYEEWDSFTDAVRLGEFDVDKLSTEGKAGSGTGSRSGQGDATGAGDTAVLPAPVAAQSWDPTSPQHAVIRAAIAWRLTENLPSHALDDQERALIKAVDALPHIDEPAPVAAQPRYVLDLDGVMELVRQYGEACKEFGDRAQDFEDAIRVALTPVPAVDPAGGGWQSTDPFADHQACTNCGDQVSTLSSRFWCDGCEEEAEQAAKPVPALEPEPAWGSGPLVEHNPETGGSGAADLEGGQR